MAPVDQIDDPPPSQLLHYLPEYQVVICTLCHYAVQPQAIPRHIKEIHHIYRARKRPYIRYIAGLNLRDPIYVEHPKRADRFPVPGLPVESGYRCDSPGCSYLCISTKRMLAHWTSEHGRKGEFEVDWFPAPLQTFFRGSLLQYFTKSASDNAFDGHNYRIKRLDQNSQGGLTHICQTFLANNTQNHGLKLDSLDTEILDHYIHSTYRTLATDRETEDIWLSVVPGLAQRYPFLMHGLLAFSALHKAYLAVENPVQQLEYTLRAYRHLETGLPLFREAIKQPNPENCHAVLVFAFLLVTYSFAIDRPDGIGSLFLCNDSQNEPGTVIPTWLHYLRSGCSMLHPVWDPLQSGPVSILCDAWDLDIEINEDQDMPYLDFFFGVIDSKSSDEAGKDALWPEDVVAIYRQTAIELSWSFWYMRGLDKPTTWDILRVWSMEVSLEYIDLLRRRHPGALILLAHYCLLLKDMEKHWYFDGRALMLVEGIQRQLHPRWHYWIQGPLDALRCGREAFVNSVL